MERKGPSRVHPRSAKDRNAYAGNSSLFLLGCCPALPIFYMNESEKWHNQSQQFNKLPDTIGQMWSKPGEKVTAAWEVLSKPILLVWLHLRDAEIPGGPAGGRTVWWRFNRTDLLSCDYEAQIADPYSPVSANLITQVIGNKREEMNPNVARSVHLKDVWDLMKILWLMHHHMRGSSNGTMPPMSSHYQQNKPCNKIKLSLKHTNLTPQVQLLLNV